jgi:hypothetical protein
VFTMFWLPYPAVTRQECAYPSITVHRTITKRNQSV